MVLKQLLCRINGELASFQPAVCFSNTGAVFPQVHLYLCLFKSIYVYLCLFLSNIAGASNPPEKDRKAAMWTGWSNLKNTPASLTFFYHTRV